MCWSGSKRRSRSGEGKELNRACGEQLLELAKILETVQKLVSGPHTHLNMMNRHRVAHCALHDISRTTRFSSYLVSYISRSSELPSMYVYPQNLPPFSCSMYP